MGCVTFVAEEASGGNAEELGKRHESEVAIANAVFAARILDATASAGLCM